MVRPEARAGTAPERRVVLLGASNLTRGCHTVLQLARHVWGGPLDVLAAWGRGRSYGWRSRLLGRELPGIATCGLWDALDRRQPVPLAALITDIGNDLLYGAETDQIAEWVEICLTRLSRADATITMTMMPMRNIETLSPRRFDFFRKLLFPGKAINLDAIVANARALDAQLQSLGRRFGVVVIEQRPEWYGLDPIHLKMTSWKRAWSEILSSWNPSAAPLAKVHVSLTRWLRLHSLAQADRSLLGRNYRRAQPVARVQRDITLSLY